ncbi:MAG: DUF5615 family PIN-like protein [bacterium]
MPRFLSDENMPRSSVELLRKSGYDAINVKDIGMSDPLHPDMLKVRKELS